MRHSSVSKTAKGVKCEKDKKSIKKTLGTSGKLTHIDKIEVNVRLSPSKAEKERGAQPIEKHVSGPHSLFNVTGYTKSDRGEKMPIYSFFDSRDGVSYTFKNNILTIALAKDWCLYDLQEGTYHKRFVDSMEWLLKSGFITFGTGSWYRAKAYYLLNRSGTVHLEHAIDCIGTSCKSVCDKVGKFYKRAGFSRLEVITSAPFKKIKEALKKALSLEVIEEIKPTILKKHVKNIFDKLPLYKIRDLFGIVTGADIKYAKKKLKTALSTLIMEKDVSHLSATTRARLHGLSHQNAM